MRSDTRRGWVGNATRVHINRINGVVDGLAIRNERFNLYNNRIM